MLLQSGLSEKKPSVREKRKEKAKSHHQVEVLEVCFPLILANSSEKVSEKRSLLM